MLWPVGIFTNYLPEGSAYIDKIDLLPLSFLSLNLFTEFSIDLKVKIAKIFWRLFS